MLDCYLFLQNCHKNLPAQAQNLLADLYLYMIEDNGKLIRLYLPAKKPHAWDEQDFGGVLAVRSHCWTRA